MNALQGLVMGLVQGLTEFLPISSSGHLAAARRIIHAGLAADVGFEVAVHAGTLLAVLIFYRQRIRLITVDALYGRNDGRAWVMWIIVGTIPAGILGLAVKDRIAELFNSLQLVGAAWIATAILLVVAEHLSRTGVKTEKVGALRAFVIGCAQALALVPGISRSGSTIAAALMTGVERRRSVDFAFLLSLPAVGGAIILTIPDWIDGTVAFTTAHMVGGLAAGISGYLAIAVMLKVVTSGKLHWFALYCLIIGLAALILG